MDILKHPIYKAIYDLCQEIEKLPASEHATKLVVMASNLQQPADQLYDLIVKVEKHNSELLVELKTLKHRIAPLLCDVAQVFDGWHNDGTAWTEHDESVRKAVSDLQKAIEGAQKLAWYRRIHEDITAAPQASLEIGQEGTRAAGMVRDPGGEWRHPTESERIFLANKDKHLQKLYPPLFQPSES